MPASSELKAPSTPKVEGEIRPDGAGLHLALLIEEGRGEWHARRIVRALEACGARVTVSSLPHCAFDTGLASGIDIPGFKGELPDGVFVRSISAGTLEQITFRLGLLHALRESGVRVWNDARVIERCVDKSTATFLFQKAGLPVPPTRVAEGILAARALVAEMGTPLVSKPLFGSQGNGVCRIDNLDDLPPPEAVGDVYYLQRYLRGPDDTRFEDYRIFVSQGRILAAMTRVGSTWITNVHQGAVPVAMHDIDGETIALALGAAKAIGADYAGVDLIRDQSGRQMVLEINSNPAWKGLQSVTDINIARTIAGDFLDAIGIRADA